MRVISLNANGIRSAAKKDFFPWLKKQKADVLCIQETKAQVNKLDGSFFSTGYHAFFCDAQKAGYSGVAIYSKTQPDRVEWGIGVEDFDNEGRWIRADFGKLSIVSLYLPSGSSSEERQQVKFKVMDWLMPKLKSMAEEDREWIICGDWNIAHKEIDLKNWRGNKKNSGFLPEEREWLTKLFDECGWVDAFRRIDQRDEQYTWWSNRGQAWAKNVGWRIDYQITTPGIAEKATAVSIYKDQRFSDHAPLTIDYAYEL